MRGRFRGFRSKDGGCAGFDLNMRIRITMNLAHSRGNSAHMGRRFRALGLGCVESGFLEV